MSLQKQLNILKTFDFGFLEEKFILEHPEFKGKFSEAAEELRKFFELVAVGDGPYAVLSKKVDALWHTFIIHTPQYNDFCQKLCGAYIHHQPHSDVHPVPEEAITNFYLDYRARFGTTPRMWTQDIPRHLMEIVEKGRVPPELLEQRWSGWTGKKI